MTILSILLAIAPAAVDANLLCSVFGSPTFECAAGMGTDPANPVLRVLERPIFVSSFE